MSTALPLFVIVPPLAASDAARLVRELPDALDAGVSGLILREGPAGSATIDPTVLAGYLVGAGPALIVEAHTSRHAPYNLARRLQSLARITHGRAGLLLQGDGIDPLTRAGHSNGDGNGPATGAHRDSATAEYLAVLDALWSSFPEEVLLGDAAAGIFADSDLVRPPNFTGSIYRVAGALNIPLEAAHRPLLALEAATLAAGADTSTVDALLTTSQPTASQPTATTPTGASPQPRHWYRFSSGVDSLEEISAAAVRPGTTALVRESPAGTDPLAALTSPFIGIARDAGLLRTGDSQATLQQLLGPREVVAA